MISFAKETVSPAERPAPSTGAKTYLWVFGTIFLLQIFLIISHIVRTFTYFSDKLESGLPSEYWWTVLDLRACAWLVLVPLIAAVIVERRFAVWKLALFHLGLVAVALVVSGNYLHRLAHIQADQKNTLVKSASTSLQSDSVEKLDSVDKTGDDITDASADSKATATKDYTDVMFHKSYGAIYWLGELMVILTSYLMMSAAGYAMLYFRLTEYRTRQAAQLRSTLTQLQHETLCNRLTPHFLFNTLNTISALISTDAKAARDCISQLGDLLRESIESLPEQEIRLDKEVEILQTYLNIQKMRFGPKLDYSIRVEEGLESAMVPAFVLQPLVENSFKHGFREHNSIARVDVTAKRLDDCCILEVVDNGAKIEPDQTLEERYGIGLTRQRLSLQYDGNAAITFMPNEPTGLMVSVRVPLQAEDEPT